MTTAKGGDIADLIAPARQFRAKLKDLKAQIAPPDFPWYPYDSLSALAHLDRLLKGDNRRLLDLAGGGAVVDIGCADGDLAFFLESLGVRMHVIENASINHNEMRGLRALKDALHSGVEIHTLDLDGQFVLPDDRYRLALMLGVLYHLKNPIYVLEALSRQTDYCALSTRVLVEDSGPVAYLLGENELNGDNSNYWLFTESGLRRLLGRTNWVVEDYTTVRDGEDLRAFCLARSRYALAHLDLLEGWHPAEPGGHRWTKQKFSAIARRADRPKSLHLKFYLPPAVMEGGRPLTLSASVGGVELEAETYDKPDFTLIPGARPPNRGTFTWSSG